MKETGILFTPDNIRAIREGHKTQTRRVIKQPLEIGEDDNGKPWPFYPSYVAGGAYEGELASSPYGIPGDRLYIKEGVITHASIPQLVGYYMDGCRVTEHWEKRLTAMFMPKWATRIWLEITDVRVERLQEISECDAIDEGTGVWFESHPHEGWDGDPDQYRKGYRELWDSINGKKYPWSANPWVFAIAFKVVKKETV